MAYQKTLMIDTNIYDLARVSYALEDTAISFEEYLLVLLAKGRKKNLKERKFFGTYQQVDVDTDSDWILDATTNEINTYLYAELEEYNDKRYTTNRCFKWVTSVLHVLSKRYKIVENWLDKLIENRSDNIVSIRNVLYRKAVQRKQLKYILFTMIWVLIMVAGSNYNLLANSIQTGMPTKVGLPQFIQVFFGTGLLGIATIGYFSAVGVTLRVSTFDKRLFKVFNIVIVLLLGLVAYSLLMSCVSVDFEKNARIVHFVVDSLQLTVGMINLCIVVFGSGIILQWLIKGVPVMKPNDMRNINISLYSIDENELWREIDLIGAELKEIKVRSIGIDRFNLTFARVGRWL